MLASGGDAVPAPAGGSYAVELRALNGHATIALLNVPHVGVGEIFLISGQSNATNYGEVAQTTQTRMVATFDGAAWRIADNPNPEHLPPPHPPSAKPSNLSGSRASPSGGPDTDTSAHTTARTTAPEPTSKPPASSSTASSGLRPLKPGSTPFCANPRHTDNYSYCITADDACALTVFSSEG